MTCTLEFVLTALDDGGSGWKALANAWSVGDIDAPRRLVPRYGAMHQSTPDPCTLAVEGGAQLFQARVARRTEAWVAAAAAREERGERSADPATAA